MIEVVAVNFTLGRLWRFWYRNRDLHSRSIFSNLIDSLGSNDFLMREDT
jgi:hypothetical protein